MANKLERKLLDQVFYEVARQCVDFEHLLWFEQDLILSMCETQTSPSAANSAASLVRRQVNRAWKRVESELHRQRADLQMAIFHNDDCPLCNDGRETDNEPCIEATGQDGKKEKRGQEPKLEAGGHGR